MPNGELGRRGGTEGGEDDEGEGVSEEEFKEATEGHEHTAL